MTTKTSSYLAIFVNMLVKFTNRKWIIKYFDLQNLVFLICIEGHLINKGIGIQIQTQIYKQNLIRIAFTS